MPNIITELFDLQKTSISRVNLQVLSTFFGYLGLDRLYVNQPFLAFLKFFTGGGFGVWAAVDAIIQLVEGFMKKPTTWIAKNLNIVDTGAGFQFSLWFTIIFVAFILFLIIGIAVSSYYAAKAVSGFLENSDVETPTLLENNTPLETIKKSIGKST